MGIIFVANLPVYLGTPNKGRKYFNIFWMCTKLLYYQLTNKLISDIGKLESRFVSTVSRTTSRQQQWPGLYSFNNVISTEKKLSISIMTALPPGLELGSSKRLTFQKAGQALEKFAHLPKTFKNGTSNDNW